MYFMLWLQIPFASTGTSGEIPRLDVQAIISYLSGITTEILVKRLASKLVRPISNVQLLQSTRESKMIGTVG